jgi:pimeloyl-ACP methyl ester carboxylesterase
MGRLFVPGFGAHPSFYRPALGDEWRVHEPPGFRSRATFEDHVAALRRRLLAADAPVVLAGHSLGAAVAVVATVEEPRLVERLLLVAPAGLPLTKPVADSLRDLRAQVRRGVYPRRALARAALDAASAPIAAWRLARATRTLDLRPELAALRAARVQCDVIGCDGDTLTPVEHCRRLAELAGGRLRRVRAEGGHMWMVVDPEAFAPFRRRLDDEAVLGA